MFPSLHPHLTDFASVLGRSIFLMILPLVQTISAETTPPRPLEVEQIKPVTVVEKEPGHLFVDFGRVAFAALELNVPQVQEGQKLTVFMGEALSAPQTVNQKPPGSVRFLRTEITPTPEKPVYRIPLPDRDQRLMPASIGPVMPFRYVEIKGAPVGFNINSITQLAVHYPFEDNAAQFKSSDEKLNAIWELCRYTIKATSYCGIFVDGDRERKPYEGDAYINQLGWFSCTTDITLPRHTWEYLIEHPTWPTDYILLAPILAWDDYLYTGNPEGLNTTYDQLKARTLLFLSRPDGLLRTAVVPVPAEIQKLIPIAKIGDLVDWPTSERDQYEMGPVNTVVNAFHCKALRCMAQIAKALNQSEDAALFQAAAAKATSSLNTVLIDAGRGLYVDGEGSRHSSLHANMFPLAFGLVPPEKTKSVVDFLGGHDMVCSVYAAQFLLDALFDYGKADCALALMTTNGDRSWRHMVDQGTTLTYEAWDQKYKPNQDWNHAWGTAPANLIPRKLMGIEPLEPGFGKILIAPKPGSLKWAQIKVPTAKGPVSVRFENRPEFLLQIEIPQKTTARVGLPTQATDGPVTVKVDGRSVKVTAKDGTVFLDNLEPGKHTCQLQ